MIPAVNRAKRWNVKQHYPQAVRLRQCACSTFGDDHTACSTAASAVIPCHAHNTDTAHSMSGASESRQDVVASGQHSVRLLRVHKQALHDAVVHHRRPPPLPLAQQRVRLLHAKQLC